MKNSNIFKIQSYSNYSFFVFFSLIWHFFLILLFNQSSLFDQLVSINKSSTAIEIIKLDKLRTLGIKDGLKDKTFSLPLSGKAAKKQKNLTSLGLGKLSLNQLNLKNGKTNNKNTIKPNETTDGDILKKIDQDVIASKASSLDKSLYRSNKNTSEIFLDLETNDKSKALQQSLKRDFIVQNENAQSQIGPIVNKSDLNFSFEPPEGVSLDELNKLELVYYSFKKRSFEKVMNSFFEQYNLMVSEYPQIRGLKVPAQKLRAKVTFDEKGDIKKIQIIKDSENYFVSKLFERTLRGIHSLQNPPKAFIVNGEFHAYYLWEII